MEEKKQETTQKLQEEIKLLTFQPQQMLNEIVKLKEELFSAKIENNSLKMFNVDLNEEINRLNKRSFRLRIQELLLRCLGGQWEEDKE